MEIIESFLPINNKEKIDQLIIKLKSIPGAMNPLMRQELLLNIKKYKLQIYLNEQYPETLFTEEPKELNVVEKMPKKPELEIIQNKETTTHAKEISLPQDSIGSKKYIYGTYIEMAFHNFFLNMRHIYYIVFGEDIMEVAKKNYEPRNPLKPNWDEDYANEALVWNPMFKKFRECQAEERQKVEELLNRHFPILKAAKDFTLNNNKYKKLDSIEILKRLSKNIRILRNYYSHVEPAYFENQVDTYNMNEELVKCILEHAFTGAKREIKARFALDETDIKCTEEFKYIRSRDERGRPKIVKQRINGFRYVLTKSGTSHLTTFGLIYFCSQFLEKKYSKIFTDKIHCIPEEEQAIMNELIAVYRIRLHQEKLYVSKNTDALAFDILTELRRCPQELFERLTPEDQAKFRISIKDDENGEGMLMIRKQDRFTHLALKYIDDAKLFTNIRFQVSLGKYFYKFYNKYCIDNSNTPRVRALSKNVNGFGRLSEIEGARKEVWDEIIRSYSDIHKNTTDEDPYITDHHAQYIINGNRIAMRIFDQTNHTHIPELDKDGVSNLAPTCWLSIYELPAMMMLIHLKGGTFVEEKIKSVVANYRKLFKDIADSKLQPVSSERSLQNILDTNYAGIHISDIPEDMLDYLTGRDCSSKHDLGNRASQLIESMIDETKHKLESFKEQCRLEGNPRENKFGKKRYVSIKPGRLASFLAKDIMLFQPNNSENKGKLTGLNFRILQSMLALYGTDDYDEDNLKRTLVSAHILGNPSDENVNPIVMRIWKRKVLPRNTKEFYKAYLEERLNYLNECKKANSVEFGFIHANRLRWQELDMAFYIDKAKRYLYEDNNGVMYDKAIELPRGMFDSEIRDELMQIEEMKDDAIDLKKNMSYLIYGYFQKVMCDDCQPIYNMDRTYAILNKLYRKSPRNPKVFYTAKQIRESLMRNTSTSLKKSIDNHLLKLNVSQKAEEKALMDRLLGEMKHTETILKRYKVQDIILFMISMKLLMTEENDINRINALSRMKLKEIMTKDALSQKIEFSVTINSKDGNKKTIYQEDLKLKDYAKFYRFVSDRRMPSLLDHINTSSVARELIEKELSGYDKVHPNILRDVFIYEQKYITRHSESKPFSAIVNNDDTFEINDKETLKWIRNSFAHCVYPQCNKIGESAQIQEIPNKAIAIADTFEEKIKKSNNGLY